MDETKRQLNA